MDDMTDPMNSAENDSTSDDDADVASDEMESSYEGTVDPGPIFMSEAMRQNLLRAASTGVTDAMRQNLLRAASTGVTDAMRQNLLRAASTGVTDAMRQRVLDASGLSVALTGPQLIASMKYLLTRPDIASTLTTQLHTSRTSELIDRAASSRVVVSVVEQVSAAEGGTDLNDDASEIERAAGAAFVLHRDPEFDALVDEVFAGVPADWDLPSIPGEADNFAEAFTPEHLQIAKRAILVAQVLACSAVLVGLAPGLAAYAMFIAGIASLFGVTPQEVVRWIMESPRNDEEDS